MGARLEWDWFHRYLPDPASLRPGTRMPTFWPDGHAANDTILGGNIDAQIEAIWSNVAEDLDRRDRQAVEVLGCDLEEDRTHPVRDHRVVVDVRLVELAPGVVLVEVPVVDERARFGLAVHDHRLGHLTEPVDIADLELDDQPDAFVLAHEP